ncbi:MAG: cobalamin-dependent protein [Nanoarchaeota archaeon]|nr:cobalamin-dependent protein [Nanoarchaeota archaeon]
MNYIYCYFVVVKMKVALIQPNLDARGNQRQAYGSIERPPETGLAVLGSWANEFSKQDHETKVFDPNRSIEDITEEASQYDILGLTDWFSNHRNCVDIARAVKSHNSQTRIVLGGPNASMMPQLILKNHPYIDFVVQRDGEESLVGLIDGKNSEEIPNLWYRGIDGRPKFSFSQFTDLKKMSLWDFSRHENVEERLTKYLEAQNSGFDPWIVPPLALFSFRGCMKAIREGVCSYCTSSEEQGRALPPEKLWQQIRHLNQTHGAEIFYMADDIFPVTSRKIKQIAEARPNDVRARIRAYGYLPDMAEMNQSELKEMAQDLERIGIFNLFFGSEHYDPIVLSGMNKRGISVEETARIIQTIYDVGGVKTTIAYLLGLPKESRETLETNLRSLEKLMEVDGCVERLYISVGMPLRGTPWFNDLERDQDVKTEYHQQTGKDLAIDDSPDYGLLSRLSLRHRSSVSPKEINEYLSRMINVSKQKMPEYRIGGFMLDIGE